MSEISSILKNQLDKIKISQEELDKINNISKEFCLNLENKLKAKKIRAEIFIGGSLAKNTLIKTDENKYDVDVFVRFIDNKNDLSTNLAKVLKGFDKIHGSRDYFQKKVENVTLEIIPVVKVKDPEEAENITDLSYFHVNYVLKKIKKNPKLSNEIKLAKAFCHGQDCYGAESYIRGFSGYALELLIIHYGSFLKFVKDMANSKENKIFVDSESFYQNKNEILMELNESKLQSPIVLVDPTFKRRNACSSLSLETFSKFKKACSEFIKNPSEDFFKKKKIEDEFKKLNNVIELVIKTNKQAGDIAGTKSKKFYNFLLNQFAREFIIKKSGFSYEEDSNIAKVYLIVDKKKDEIVRGPDITKVEHLKRFREKHKDAFIKNQICYAEIKHDKSFNEFFKIFLEKNKKVLKQMGISELKIG